MNKFKAIALSAGYAAIIASTITIANVLPSSEAQAEVIEYRRIEDIHPTIVMPCDLPHIEQENPIFTVNGEMLNEDLQKYIFNRMKEEGCESYYQFWLCEIYQESRFVYNAVSPDQMDYGFCQLRKTYHTYFCELAGHPEFDVINDYYANLYIGTFLFCKNLKESNFDLSSAIMKYFNSGDPAADFKYLQDVSQWFSTVERK